MTATLQLILVATSAPDRRTTALAAIAGVEPVHTSLARLGGTTGSMPIVTIGSTVIAVDTGPRQMPHLLDLTVDDLREALDRYRDNGFDVPPTGGRGILIAALRIGVSAAS
ncbi:hypothetical protein [Tsukamurella soli]